MTQVANPEMLILAREVRGWTQTTLEEKSGIDQGRISRYENGQRAVPDDELEVLAQALDFPVEFFFQEGKRVPEVGAILHRKRQALPATQQKRIDGLLNVYRFGLNRLLAGVRQKAILTVPTYSLDMFGGDIEQIAEAVRRIWDVESGPIPNLVELLEAASCMIFSYDLDTDLLDEAVLPQVDGLPPIILINNRAPGDRLRFSLAHALGHLVMQHPTQVPDVRLESEADQFASAFLMPADDIRPELQPVTISHMLELKKRWKVSMQALIRRARDLGEISERQYTSLFQMLSRAGYRKNEPFEIEREKPSTARRLLDGVYREQLNFSTTQLAALVNLSVEDFRSWYYETPRLSVVRR